MISNHKIVVTRDPRSYKFKKDDSKGDSWDGDSNAQNNKIDLFQLMEHNVILFEARCQSVANMPGARHTDTLVPGSGWMRWNVPKRDFTRNIHGLWGFIDQDGQFVTSDSITPIPTKDGAPEDWLRSLVHSDLKKDGSGRTRFAWSASCIILEDPDLMKLNAIGFHLGFTDGDDIPLTIVEGETNLEPSEEIK